MTNQSRSLAAKKMASILYYGETSNALWYFNFRATNHISKDHEGILAKIYKGNDKIYTASGEPMNNTHMGTPQLSLEVSKFG